jgi:hypothetical protein
MATVEPIIGKKKKIEKQCTVKPWTCRAKFSFWYGVLNDTEKNGNPVC